MLPSIKTSKVVDGLGFGDGDVSFAAQASVSGNAALHKRIETIVHDARILVPVDATAHDDGCGDGRGVATRVGAISSKVNGKIQTFSRSLHRAKVFGGGATMATAMRIGTGDTNDTDMLAEVFTKAIAALQQAGIDFGGHTHEDAEAPNSGCGAIDEAPAVIRAAGTYRDQITAVIAQLLGQSGDPAAMQALTAQLDVVFNRFAAQEQHLGEYQGAVTMQAIADAGKVIKELAGAHSEVCIVLKMVQDYTVDQTFFRAQTDQKLQTFAVDVWRMQQLAQALYSDEQSQQLALLSEFVYTLATAAVLTKGDLPVYILNR